MFLPETQQQIVDYLSKNRLASCRELSDFLGTTRANIQHHLSGLRCRGIIEPAGKSSHDQPAARGRPWRYYRLAGRYAQHNLEDIARSALHLLTSSGAVSNEEICTAMAQTICAGYLQEQNVTRRLAQAINFLNHRYYQAHWEAARSGPKIVIKNCPYASIVNQFPILCQVDRIILRRLIGLECQQIAKMSLMDNSVPGCVFLAAP